MYKYNICLNFCTGKTPHYRWHKNFVSPLPYYKRKYHYGWELSETEFLIFSDVMTRGNITSKCPKIVKSTPTQIAHHEEGMVLKTQAKRGVLCPRQIRQQSKNSHRNQENELDCIEIKRSVLSDCFHL